jgi:hypothetical protein
MVARKAIGPAERFGVWKAWGGRCFWCREPVLFRNTHIDHVLPLGAAEQVGGLAALKTRYSLPADFEVDDFPNWVPACPSCNQRKSGTLLDSSPQFVLHLMHVRSKAGLAASIAAKLSEDRGKAPLLAKIMEAVSVGDITREEIEELIRDLPVVIRKAFELPEERLLIAPGWEIVERNGSQAVVRAAGV